MIKLSRVFLRKLISRSLKEGRDIEDTIELTRNSVTDNDDDLSFSSLGFEGDDDLLSFEFTDDVTQVKDPERTRLSFGSPPKRRSSDYDENYAETATNYESPYSPTSGDFEPFTEDFYNPPDYPPVFHKEDNEETQFGGKRDQEFDDSGLADYLKSIGDPRDTIKFRKDLVDKIDKLKQDLREGNLRGQDRLSKIIELSIFENIYRQTLRG